MLEDKTAPQAFVSSALLRERTARAIENMVLVDKGTAEMREELRGLDLEITCARISAGMWFPSIVGGPMPYPWQDRQRVEDIAELAAQADDVLLDAAAVRLLDVWTNSERAQRLIEEYNHPAQKEMLEDRLARVKSHAKDVEERRAQLDRLSSALYKRPASEPSSEGVWVVALSALAAFAAVCVVGLFFR